jgi:hypothetical protein
MYDELERILEKAVWAYFRIQLNITSPNYIGEKGQ